MISLEKLAAGNNVLKKHTLVTRSFTLDAQKRSLNRLKKGAYGSIGAKSGHDAML